MKQIESNETEILGHSIIVQGKIIDNDTTQRIFELVSRYLIKLNHDQSGWDTLYRDPKDGRLWELFYPLSEIQGGGPPSLIVISLDKAIIKYTI